MSEAGQDKYKEHHDDPDAGRALHEVLLRSKKLRVLLLAGTGGIGGLKILLKHIATHGW